MEKWFVGLVVAAAILSPGLAFAGHDDSVVGFEEIEGNLEDDRLELNYTIDRASWRALENRDVLTRLNLFVERDGTHERTFAYSVELAHRKGHFAYPRSVQIGNGDRISFEVVGYAGAFRVEGLRYRGNTYSSVALEVYSDCTNLPGQRRERARGDRHHDHDRDDERQRRHRRDRDAYADRGGRDEHDWNHHEHDSCVSDCPYCGQCDSRHDRDRDRDAGVDIIRACKDAVFSSRVDQCVSRAKSLTAGNEAATISACDDAFIGDRDVLSCLERSRGHAWEPAETIAACDSAFISSRSTLSCIDKTRDSRSRPAPLVSACDSAVIGERDTLSCIDESRS